MICQDLASDRHSSPTLQFPLIETYCTYCCFIIIIIIITIIIIIIIIIVIVIIIIMIIFIQMEKAEGLICCLFM